MSVPKPVLNPGPGVGKEPGARTPTPNLNDTVGLEQLARADSAKDQDSFKVEVPYDEGIVGVYERWANESEGSRRVIRMGGRVIEGARGLFSGGSNTETRGSDVDSTATPPEQLARAGTGVDRSPQVDDHHGNITAKSVPGSEDISSGVRGRQRGGRRFGKLLSRSQTGGADRRRHAKGVGEQPGNTTVDPKDPTTW